MLLFIGCFRSEDLARSPFLHEIRKAMAKGSGGLITASWRLKH